MARWFIAVFIPLQERLIERRSHLENHRACPRQWFVVDESKASRPNRASERMLDTCRGLASNAITFRGELIERNARWANRPIDFTSVRENRGRLQVVEGTAFAPGSRSIANIAMNSTHVAHSRQFAGILNAFRGYEISRCKNSDKTGRSAFARGNCFSAKGGGEVVWRASA